MTEPESADLAEALAKLVRRLDDMEQSIAEQRDLLRQIADGRLRIAITPVTARLGQNEEMTATMRLLLDVLAGTIVTAALIGALLYYLVDKPWPLGLHIPPPHSTERKLG